MSNFTTWRSLVDGEEIAGIPDSAVSQYRIDEGSDSTLNNEFDGQPDGTIYGASWIEDTDLTGGWGLDFGGEDYVDIDSQFDFIDDEAELTFCVTIDVDSLNADDRWWHHTDGSTYAIGVGIDQDGDGVSARFNDDRGDIQGDIGTTDISAGRVRVGVWLDVQNFDAQFAINGDLKDKESLEGRATENGAENTFGDLRGDDSGDFNFEGILDNPIWYDKKLSESEFEDDYNAQPWS